MNKHTFDQASWRVIKEFAGVYGVKMDYSTILKLHVSDIHDAMRWSDLIPPTFIYNHHNQKSWKLYMLKRVTRGYKSRQFYEEIELKIEIYNQTHNQSNKQSIYHYTKLQ